MTDDTYAYKTLLATGSLAARLDGCPSCVVNTEVPFGTFQTHSRGVVALYKCTDCGHRWHTSWAIEAAIA